MNESERPLWFGSESRPVFGWLGLPDGEARGGVIFCAPVGSHARAAHRAFRDLAATLRCEGFATLRFDYDGCGDSAGGFSDPDRVRSWSQSVGDAVELLRAAGVRQVSAIGMRLGATILCEAVSTLPLELHSAVLWDPVTRGKRFLREEQLLLAVAAGARETRSDGAIETSGYLIPPAMAAEIGGLDLRRILSRGTIGRRSLVMLRPGAEGGDSLFSAGAAQEQDDLEFGTALGQEELLEVSPDLAELPVESMSRITAWLTEEGRADSAVNSQVGRDEAIIGSETGTGVVEHHRYLGSAQMSAIVTEPAPNTPSAIAQADAPWLVFLNNGAETRIGPGRSWVNWSRAWAREGFRSVRVDLSGLGDSGVHVGQAPHVVYSPFWLDDMQEIVDTVAPGGPSQTVVVGLCSGAYSALEAALGPRPPRGVIAINPILRTDTAYEVALADARRKAWRPQPRVLSKLSRKHPLAAHRLWRIGREFAVNRSPMDVLARASRAGVDVLAIFGPSDMWQFGNDLYWTRIGKPRLQRRPDFDFTELEDLDHSLYLDEAQTSVEKVAYQHLRTRYLPEDQQ